MRAIDLYSGIGGWSLGLRLAGVRVVAAYEWWDSALDTYSINLRHSAIKADIRKLNPRDLPRNVDIIVGSPPCTQFSFSNRGGKGDIADGLKDIAKFLEIVKVVQPRYWVMENVPRVKAILEHELHSPKGRLRQYQRLFANPAVQMQIFDMADFGLPQSRKRCIAGKIPFELLNSYVTNDVVTLGNVVSALNGDVLEDPLYGMKIAKHKVTDHVLEQGLTEEETRLNRDAKLNHPVYNKMAFPDAMNRPSRTVTATCTRVSRESIVIKYRSRSNLRRLTLRERACLQGFPITYQFFADSAAMKAKMIGNAIPPAFTYQIGCALRGIERKELPSLKSLKRKLPVPRKHADSLSLDSIVPAYTAKRSFKASIPKLRFKSGVRFEFANHVMRDHSTAWGVTFLYGTPQDIRKIKLNRKLQAKLHRGRAYKLLKRKFGEEQKRLEHTINEKTRETLQSVWSRQVDHGVGPYKMVDKIGSAASRLAKKMNGHSELATEEVMRILKAEGYMNGKGTKMRAQAVNIYVGLLLGCWVNQQLS